MAPGDGTRDAAGRVYRRRREDAGRDDRADGGGDLAPRAPEGGLLIGLPIWARVVGLVGIPGTIALFAVWVGSQSLPRLETEVIALKQAMQAQSTVTLQLSVKAEEQTRLLQKICSAQFTTEEEKQRCFDR
jgi:hypothetical protein